jgi:peroxiredoxin
MIKQLTLIRIIACVLIVSSVSIGCSKKNHGYAIRVRIRNIEASGKIYLKAFNGNDFIPVDSVSSGLNGEAGFSGSKPLEPGMYSTGVKGKNEADFFISSAGNQYFSVSFDPDYFQQTLSFKGTPENEAFWKHLKTMESVRKQIRQLQVRMQQYYQIPDSVQSIKDAAKKLQKEAEEKTAALENKFPGTLLALNLKTNSDPVIPEPVIPLVAANREQAIQEYYYRQTIAHYFDNFDFSDTRLVKLPVLKQKMGYYFTQLLVPQPDTLIFRLDQLLSETRINPVVHTWSIKYLYNLFRESPFPGLTGISSYIAEKYILTNQGLFSDSVYLTKIRIRLEKAKMNPVGEVVTNLKLQTTEGKTVELHKLKAPAVILYFFNPGCDACHAVTDKLLTIYHAHKTKEVAVFAVYTDRNRDEWTRYIENNKLDWINVFDLNGTEGIEVKYDVSAIPMIYLLDKDKKVVLKDVPVEMLDNYLNNNKK